ncbi:MAG: hypothetical protein PHN38_03475 [Sulfurospirillaceae bacterium]|nr:hypothetical protein [Sulfurospirillaceae bacterium]MDD3462649.1 hypothetical protein [Sulfurospirillaceae bacterium]
MQLLNKTKLIMMLKGKIEEAKAVDKNTAIRLQRLLEKVIKAPEESYI